MVGSLTTNLLLFVVAAGLIGGGGVLLTRRAEEIAKITGLGDLLTGAILIGAVTSLSGSIMSVSATWNGDASLAVSNAVGGIAVQTTFLAIADMAYRRANLEHAAASEPNLLQGVVLIGLLALPLFAMTLPGLGGLGVHPVSVLIVAGYVLGLRLTRGAERAPMWQPRLTSETPPEKAADETPTMSVVQTWLSFIALAALVSVCGWVLSQVAPTLSEQVGMDQSLMGGVFTATATSLPELVVAVTAVRRGSLSLAVGDILGGNSYDLLILVVLDAVYRDGTIYAAVGPAEMAWVVLSIVLVSMLMMGLLRRQEHGVGNVGFETVLMFVLYAGGVTAITLS